MPSIKELVDETGLLDADIANAADISLPTFYNIKSGKEIRAKTAWKLIRAINEILGTSYRLKDITGITVRG